MATKTAVQNMAQAGDDLLAIKGAIEGEGVEIASATPTSNYAGLITNNLVKPTGTLNITENGEFDVAQYAMAEVDVAGGITINESYNVSEGTLQKIIPSVIGDYILTIPNGVTTISNSVLKDERGNKTINPFIITKIIMPNTVTEILGGAPWSGGSAFEQCFRLNEIVFSNSLETIGDYVFSNCEALTVITIPDSVTSIGSSAFSDCTSLTSITIPDSLTSIGSGAFANCTNLSDIYYTGTQAEWEAIEGIAGAGIPEGATIHYEYTPA